MSGYIPVTIHVPTELYEKWQYCNRGLLHSDEEIALSLSLMLADSLLRRVIGIWENDGPYEIQQVNYLPNGTAMYGVFYCESGKEPRRMDKDTNDNKNNKLRKCRRENLRWNEALFETK